METSLHRQLKQIYTSDPSAIEVPVGSFRVDAVVSGCVIEIQHGSLASIRNKVLALLEDYPVLVAKPLIAGKQLIKRSRKRGRVTSRRRSPKRGSFLDVFDELVYFTEVFPHPNLALDAVLVDVEEWRYPGHGRRRRWSQRDHVVEDRKLLDIRSVYRLRTARDLWQLLSPVNLPRPFHTGHLASSLDISRSTAQQIAYVLRKSHAIRQVGKQRNALLYELTDAATDSAVPDPSVDFPLPSYVTELEPPEQRPAA